jgi:hypothetical protein
MPSDTAKGLDLRNMFQFLHSHRLWQARDVLILQRVLSFSLSFLMFKVFLS